jgi:hypothetical protein
MRLFFALSAAMGFVVMDHYANSRRHSVDIRGSTMPMPSGIARHGRKLTALWYYRSGPWDSEALWWGKAHQQILDDLDIVYTTHERSIYR